MPQPRMPGWEAMGPVLWRALRAGRGPGRKEAPEQLSARNLVPFPELHRLQSFLPQVATETGWTTEEFLGHCARDKAGIGWNGWKDAELYTYQTEIVEE